MALFNVLDLRDSIDGNRIKQGDLSNMRYILTDTSGDDLNMEGMPAVVYLSTETSVQYRYKTKVKKVRDQENKTYNYVVDVVINDVIPANEYMLEIHVNEQYIFPSDNKAIIEVTESVVGRSMDYVRNNDFWDELLDYAIANGKFHVTKDSNVVLGNGKSVTVKREDIEDSNGRHGVKLDFYEYSDAQLGGLINTAYIYDGLDGGSPSLVQEILYDENGKNIGVQLIVLDPKGKEVSRQNIYSANKIDPDSITTEMLKNKIITPEKTNFITTSTSNNLLDLTKVQYGKSVDTNGAIIDDSARWVTGLIPINPKLFEKVSFTNGTYRIPIYDENGTFLARRGVTSANKFEIEFTSNARYFRLSGTGDINNLMINKGDTLLPYEKPITQSDQKLEKRYLPIITNDLLEAIETKGSSNLLNLNTVLTYTTLDDNGNMIDDNARWLSDYISVDSSKDEQIWFNDGVYKIFLYKGNTPADFITKTGAVGNNYKPNASTGTKYIRISGTTDLNDMMLNKGDKLLPYEDYHPIQTKLKKDLIPKITYDMLNMIVTKVSRNLFNKNEVIKGKTLDDKGQLVDDSLRWISGYIPVDSSKDEQVWFNEGAYRVYMYKEANDNGFIARTGATGKNYKPNASTGTRFIRLSGTSDIDSMMVNKGNKLLPFEEYYPTQVKIKDSFIPKIPNELLNILETKVSTNLLNISNVLLNKTLDDNGKLIDDEARWLTDYILLDSSKNEQLNFPDGSYRVYMYRDANENAFIGRTGANGTSYKPNASTGAKYIRLSGTSDINKLMLNKGDKLLPYEKPYGKQTKIKQEFLPDLSSTNTNSSTISNSSYQYKMEQNVQTYTPNFPKLEFEEVSTGYDEVLNMSKDGKRIYGKTGHMLWVSKDECKTKTPIIQNAGNSIQAVRELDDGELLFSTERDTTNGTRNGCIFKTKGYNKDTSQITSYDKKVETPSSQAKVTNSWGMSVYKNIIVASEYGLKTSEGARRVWLSRDYGETFEVIFDQMTYVEKIKGAPSWAGDTAHVHSCAFDPYWNRIWVVTGDHPNSAMYYSDDFGLNWTWIDVGNKPVVQHTGIIALPNCVLFGSDRAPNGVYVYYRGQKSDMPVVEPLLLINDWPTISHVFQLPFKKDWDSLTPVYFSGTAAGDLPSKSVCVATVDGKKAFVIHENESNDKFGGKSQAYIGPTAQGNIVASFNDNGISGFRIGKAKAPEWNKM